MTCKSCKFRLPDERPIYINHGYCRRFPPQIVSLTTANGDAALEQHFPWMTPDDWCGEYQRHATMKGGAYDPR